MQSCHSPNTTIQELGHLAKLPGDTLKMWKKTFYGSLFFFKCTSETYCHRELQSQTVLGCSKSLNSWTTDSYMDTTQMTQGCTLLIQQFWTLGKRKGNEWQEHSQVFRLSLNSISFATGRLLG